MHAIMIPYDMIHYMYAQELVRAKGLEERHTLVPIVCPTKLRDRH